MHVDDLKNRSHGHLFHHPDAPKQAERRTLGVIALTGTMMILEVLGGKIFGSMALLADGWHMGTHAAALSITAYAYVHARRHADDPAYTFGTGKVGVLGGYTSAVVLALIALLMAWESFKRLLNPVSIHFNEALIVACMGLVVNLLSAWLLTDARHGKIAESPGSGSLKPHTDHNLRAAYFHVVADALTSVLAIVALLFVKSFGWVWMDAIMGLVGAAIIMRWAQGLLRDTSRILLDSDARSEMMGKIREAIESDADNRVSDLHLWRVGPNHFAAIITLSTHHPRPPEHYKSLVAGFKEICHITVEINRYPGPSCVGMN